VSPVTLLLLVTFVTAGAVGLQALRQPRLFSMAWRNILRRKSNAALVVGGLLIGTAIISGSLVMGDTLENIFVSEVYWFTGENDLLVYGFDPTGGFKTFNETYFDELAANGSIQDLRRTGDIDGLAPILLKEGAIILLNGTDEWTQGEPRINVIGIDPAAEQTFGDRPLANIDHGSGEGVALNFMLADELGAAVGDRLLLFPGREDLPADLNISVEVTRVYPEEHGDADLLGGMNCFMELTAAQELYNLTGRINGIRISTEGGIRNEARGTGTVHRAVNDTLNDLVTLDDLGLSLAMDDLTLLITETLLGEDFLQRLEEREEVTSVLPLLTVPVAIGDDQGNGSDDGNGSTNGSSHGSGQALPLMLLGADLEEVLQPGILYTSSELAVHYNLSNATNLTSLLTGSNFSLTVETLNLTELGLALPPDAGLIGVVQGDTARSVLFGQTDFVAYNGVLLTAAPGANGSAILAQEITLAEMGLETHRFKEEFLEIAENAAEMITQIFLVLGLFSIAAGIMLIINIFVMLASERRGEMGISRALGMQRTHLLQIFLFEGTIYAVLAAGAGTLMGIGVGFVIIQAFSYIFAEGQPIGELFTYTGQSLTLAFAAGMLVTTLTVLVASWKVSKLNIVTAIRNIPEGLKATTNLQRLGGVGLAVGVLFTLVGFSTTNYTLIIMGPCLAALGAIPLAIRWSRSADQAMFVGGLVTALWALDPLRLAMDDDNFVRFFSDGMLLVTGGLLMLLSQTHRILRFLDWLTARSKYTALFKTGLAYPLHNRFRTGMTLAMFALIIFTVTTISLWQSIFASSNSEFMERESGGYQIIAFLNPDVEVDLEAELAATENERLKGLAPLDEGGAVGLLRVHMANIELHQGANQRVSNLYGVDGEWLTHSEYTFAIDHDTEEEVYARGFSYLDREGVEHTIEEPGDVWNAMARNDTLFVGDGSFLWVQGEEEAGPPQATEIEVGDEVQVEVGGLARNGTLIGILQQEWFLHGLFVNATFAAQFGADSPEVYLFRLQDPSLDNSVRLAEALEEEYILYGTDTMVIEEEINEGLKQFQQIMNLVQGFLGLGLIVGIAGLGIIAVRAVHERFHEIGVMRAIGYTRESVMGTFVVEVSFVALLGILLGVVLGLLSMYNVFLSIPDEEGFKFVVDWLKLTIIMSIAYIASLLAAIGPSRAAARVAPAEALRYE